MKEVTKQEFEEALLIVKAYQAQILKEYDCVKSVAKNIVSNDTRLVDLDLSVRTLNCLKAAEIGTVGELLKIRPDDKITLRNFGKRSLTEVEELIAGLIIE
jgi:DNA-directed RNA polymerase alpha subunit